MPREAPTMIFPRYTALVAAAAIERAIVPLSARLSHCGDLRLEKSTLSRIEFVLVGTDRPSAVQAMATARWRELRAGRGPIAFAREGFPKAVLCLAHPGR